MSYNFTRFLKGFLFSLLLLASQHIFAVTAKPESTRFLQPDGSHLTILLHGDEFVHWATTLDGYTVLSSKSGAYEYAATNASGELGFSGVVAHDPALRSIAELTFMQSIQPGLFFSKTQIKEMKAILEGKHAPSKPTMGSFPTVGTHNFLMILANFNNTTTTYTQNDFNNFMNQTNYNTTGSFKDYYLEVSYGALIINTTVTIWVTLPHTHDYYGPQSTWGDFAYDAVVAANNQAAVNYSLYDNDFDGYVDGVAIVHQGRGQEESGNINDIWSHSWDLQSAGYTNAQCTFDGVIVSQYTTEPEKGSSSTITTIGVMCHEFGHNLGAPDFYDTDYGTSGQYDGTGQWDIMANGSWNGSPAGSKPCHHNAWTKSLFTWTTPTTLTTQQNVLLRRAELYTDAVRYNTNTANEYFLCENRQQVGFDTYIPGHGMIIYHVDGSYITIHTDPNDINCTSHQGMYPMSATSTTANGIMTSSSSTINTSGCPWPGTSNKTTFSDVTTPNSKSWAGVNTAKPLLNITENTIPKEITFCFIACANLNDPQSLTATAVSTSQINLVWTKNGSNDPVMVAYNTSNTFGTPTNGSTYIAGNTITGGGTVLYNGANTTFNHTSLNPNTTYYYKAWSVMSGNAYSPGITANATTFCSSINTLPFSEGFSTTSMPSCWSVIDNQGNGQVWQFGTITGYSPNNPNLTGNYAYLNSDAYGSSGIQNTSLVTPTLDLTNYSNITLQFNHYYRHYTGSTATLSYSVNNGSTWTTIQTWTATTANPAAFNQVIAALAGQSQVKFRWTYTGSYGYYWAVDDVLVTGSASTPTLLVSPANQNVAATAGSTTFNVTSNSNWTVSSNQTWCTVTPSGTGNGTITANVTANPNTTARVANITVTVTGIPAVVVTVTQAGATPTLGVTPSNQNVPSTSGSTSFTVTSNSSWTVTSNQSWCTVTSSGTGNGTITANYTTNALTGSRVADITVTVTGISPVVVTVTQAGAAPTLSVSPSNQTVIAAPGSTNFTVTSNSNWTVTSDQSWCTVTTSGSGNGTIVATYTENTSTLSRVANITTTVPGIPPVIVTVTQGGAAPLLIVDPSNQNVASTSGATTFTVTSNTSWVVTSNQSWCVVTSSGSGNGVITAQYEANPTASTRVATITTTVSGFMSTTNTVTQTGLAPTLTVSPPSRQVTYNAGSTTFNVTSNSNWSATSDQSWCVVTSSGNGNAIITANYSDNSGTARVATISVNVTGLSPVNVTVNQDGIVGIDPTTNAQISILPNPNNGRFELACASLQKEEFIVKMFDAKGQHILSRTLKGSDNYSFDLSYLSKGEYYLRVMFKGELIVKKVLIQ